MWYAVETLFRCNEEKESGLTLYDKRIFLIKSETVDSARQKANQIASTSEVTYQNSDSEQVHWEFLRILEIQELCEGELYDGIEVFSQLMWESEIPDDI